MLDYANNQLTRKFKYISQHVSLNIRVKFRIFGTEEQIVRSNKISTCVHNFRKKLD